MTRREFIRNSASSGGALLLVDAGTQAVAQPPEASQSLPQPSEFPSAPAPKPANTLPNLAPAHWIWYPSGRCLQNTFVLFRRELVLDAKPLKATGWIAADSRYRLEVNGKRVQWGPAPSDPRWPEADPIDLTEILKPGANVLGAVVLYYGQGDGTCPAGKPGFLFRLELEMANGTKQTIVSDTSWAALLARAWQPGHYKRWYLRALQEEFNASLYPYGWSDTDFAAGKDWLPAMVLEGAPNKPSICTNYPEYMLDVSTGAADAQLLSRRIPMLRETSVPVKALAESFWIEWLRPPQDYFDCRVPNAFKVDRNAAATQSAPAEWEITMSNDRGASLIFEFAEQMVGWPGFTIDAPAGAVIEMMVQEGHQVGGPALLNTHFDGWTRFICREGTNTFETFDFECCRWLQLHIRNAQGKIKIRNVQMRRRIFPWPNAPKVQCSDPALQRLLDASVNTLNNSAQETCVDGMGRERQQYSGDGGHQLHALRYTFGESRLPARFLATFSQGMTLDGFFLDCWPAYDRLARLMERQLQLTNWGPILDHGVGFNFDCWYHYLYTGDLEALREPYPRLLRFARYLREHLDAKGLLGVENLGVPSVWIDHNAYQQQRHKQCAFNLYAAAALEHALAPLCRAFGDHAHAGTIAALGSAIRAATIKNFWSADRQVFINNLPWLADEKHPRMCDRSLATAILFDQCPSSSENSLKVLTQRPPEMGYSYPANACWRTWALAKGRRPDLILNEFRESWVTMGSVTLNNTLQEDWVAQPDSHSQWSHCAVVPLYAFYMSIAGIRPLQPGFVRAEIRPQLADLDSVALTAYTPRGPLAFQSKGRVGHRELTLEIPKNCEAELAVDEREELSLKKLSSTEPGLARYLLPGDQTYQLALKFT